MTIIQGRSLCDKLEGLPHNFGIGPAGADTIKAVARAKLMRGKLTIGVFAIKSRGWYKWRRPTIHSNRNLENQ